MDLIASLLTFTMFWKISWSLQCYKCDPEHTSHACANFDHSDKYLTECQHSTMCIKKITTLHFGDGLTSQSIQRGCAPQFTSGEQKKIDKKWYPVEDIREVYPEDCLTDDPTKTERATKTTHCYCRGNRCNGANAQKILTSILSLTIIIITLSVLS